MIGKVNLTNSVAFWKRQNFPLRALAGLEMRELQARISTWKAGVVPRIKVGVGGYPANPALRLLRVSIVRPA